MNVSSSKPGLSPLMEKVKPARAGSLPFKKRRFPRLAFSELNNEGNEGEKPAFLLPPDSANCASDAVASSAEKIAVLALVAAAAAGKDADEVSAIVPEGESTKAEPKKHGFSFYQQGTSEPSADRATTLNSALFAAAADLQSLHDATLLTDSDATSIKRLHRQSLTSPLPNGCHGRTSRNNSYCRRQPYNGSHFCKSHYQSLVVSGVVTEEELKEGKVVESGEMLDTAPGGLMCGPADGTKVLGTVLPTVQQQDKRYTGADAEIRCKATTTRGRDCSYCTVNDTKYCHLHATFDTHPPPRRGGASFANAAKGKEGWEATKNSSGASKSGKAVKTDGPKRKSPSMSARRLSTTKNLEKHMASAPYPLLSTLATDKWLHRKVIVSTGPLTNHVGLVEKWGNGWISVRLPGVGLHNRRSFELYLHPNPDSDGDAGSSTSLEKVAPRVVVFDASNQRTSVPKKGVDKTPPTPLSSDRPLLDMSTVHEVTPLTSCRVIGIDQSLPKGNGGARRVSSIMFPQCLSSSDPTTVPESPVPNHDDAPTDGANRRGIATLGIDGTGSQSEGDCSGSKLQFSAKPPVEADHNEIPLVQSLLFAQGRSAKNKLGLLFGTAALERSRRNIHKPKRYEDTELIAKKLKKRDRGEVQEHGFGVLVKRHRVEPVPAGTSTPVISSSSSDEEVSDVPASMASV